MARTFVKTGKGYYGGYTVTYCDTCRAQIKIEDSYECGFCGGEWHATCQPPCPCPRSPSYDGLA